MLDKIFILNSEFLHPDNIQFWIWLYPDTKTRIQPYQFYISVLYKMLPELRSLQAEWHSQKNII